MVRRGWRARLAPRRGAVRQRTQRGPNRARGRPPTTQGSRRRINDLSTAAVPGMRTETDAAPITA